MLCVGKDSILQEIKEQEDGHPVYLRKLLDVLADELNEICAPFLLHEEFEHQIWNYGCFEEGNESLDGIYMF